MTLVRDKYKAFAITCAVNARVCCNGLMMQALGVIKALPS